MVGTSKLRELYERFEQELGRRQERAKSIRPMWDPPKTKLDEDPGVQTCKTSWVQSRIMSVVSALSGFLRPLRPTRCSAFVSSLFCSSANS